MFYKATLLLCVTIIFGACTSGKKVYQVVDIPSTATDTPCNDSNYIRGVQMLKNGDPKEALQLFQRSNCPEDIKSVGIGYAYLSMKDNPMAESSFNRALEINPENQDASLGLAKFYEETGNNKKAWYTYSSILTRNPENRDAKEGFVILSNDGKSRKLREAEEFLKNGNYDKYINALEEASLYSSEDVELLKKIGLHYFQKEDYIGSLKYFEKLLSLEGESEELNAKLAVCYANTGKIDAAIILYSRQLQRNPGSIELQNKINELKVRFVETELPNQFRDIFFKDQLNREDLAILIGYYFKDYLDIEGKPLIITDINRTFSREYIIKVATHGIMQIRPDHSFGGNLKVNKIEFASAMKKLMEFLIQRGGVKFSLSTVNRGVPADIDEGHRFFTTINFVVGYGIMDLDEEENFNSSEIVNPVKGLETIRRILNLIEN